MADTPAQVALEEKGLAAFTDYFVRNYPGPDTIIHDPCWHAPRIYRHAVHAYLSSLSGEAGDDGQGALVERKWIVWWQGSGPERGDHVMGYAGEIAYIGDQHHEQAHAIVGEHNATVERNRTLTRENAALRADKERLERERDYAVGKEREVAATIKRVWAALGNPEFETLYGRTISEVVADWKNRAEAAERRLAEQGQGEAVHEITQECRYCANTGWFYGDPDLHSYCGCAFGKLRGELSAAPPSPEPDAELVEALAPFAAAIAPDPDCVSGWRFGIKPRPEDFQRAFSVLARHRKQGGE